MGDYPDPHPLIPDPWIKAYPAAAPKYRNMSIFEVLRISRQ